MSGFRAVTVRNILRLHDPFSSPAMISALESAIASEGRILAPAGPGYSPQKTLSVSSPVATTSGCRLPQALFVPAPFKNFRLPHICGMSTNVKVFSVGRLVKK